MSPCASVTAACGASDTTTSDSWATERPPRTSTFRFRPWDGARATMGAELKAGVEKVVYTSSVAALKPGATAVDPVTGKEVHRPDEDPPQD